MQVSLDISFRQDKNVDTNIWGFEAPSVANVTLHKHYLLNRRWPWMWKQGGKYLKDKFWAQFKNNLRN